MKFVILLGLAVLLFGCVVQPTGPLENSIEPPNGLDVKEAFETEDSTPDLEENETVETNESSANETAAANETAESNVTSVESSELSMHGSTSDCWVLYDGEVYDVTSYLLKHPGGSQPIAEHCGKTDSSFADAFEGEHGMSKVGFLKNMPHMGSMMDN